MFNIKDRFSRKAKKESEKENTDEISAETEIPESETAEIIDNMPIEEELKKIENTTEISKDKTSDEQLNQEFGADVAEDIVAGNENIDPSKKEEIKKIYSEASTIKSTANSDYLPLESKVVEDLQKIQESKKELKELKIEVEELTGKRDYIKKDLENIQSEINTVRTELDKLQMQKESGKANLESIQAEINTAKYDLEKLQSQRESSRADLEKIQDEINTATIEKESAKTDLESTKNALETAKTDLESTKNALETAKTDLESTSNEITIAQEQIEKLDSNKVSNADLENIISKINTKISAVNEPKNTSNRSESIPYEWMYTLEQLRNTIQKTQADNQLLNYKIDTALDEIKSMKMMFNITANYANLANVQTRYQPSTQTVQEQPKQETPITKEEKSVKEDSANAREENIDVTDKPDEIKIGLANLIKSAKSYADIKPEDTFEFEEMETSTPVEPQTKKSTKDPNEILEAASKVVASLNTKFRMKEREFERIKHSLESELGITKRMLEKERLEHKKSKESESTKKEEINQ